jgi:putative ABC transport system permease protein
MTRRTRRLVRAWARTLERLYPPSHRRRVGIDLSRMLEDQASDAAARGPGAILAFLTVNTAVALRDALLEWGEAVSTLKGTGAGGGVGMGTMARALGQVLRGLSRRPGYAVPILVTIALGVGANTAMFSVLYGVVLRPLPYPDADRIVLADGSDPARGDRSAHFALPDVRDLAEGSQRLAQLGAYTTLPSDLVLTGDGEAREVETAFVSTGFFEALGTGPLYGRTLGRSDEIGDDRVVVVSHAFWVQHLGGELEAVGRPLVLSDASYRVVGVMPASFAFPTPRTEVWVLLSTIPSSSIPLEIRGVKLLDAVGRLSAGSTLSQAESELSGLAAALAERYPDENGRMPAVALTPLHQGLIGGVDRALAVLMAAALLILVLVCANVANLALAREASREPEMALRAALGASGARRAAVVVTESLALSLTGGAIGLAIAWWGTDLLVGASAGTLPRAEAITPDWRMAVFSLASSVAIGLAFALLPGLKAGGRDLADRLRAGSGRSAPVSGRGALVASQMALAMVLMVGSTLLVRSLWSLRAVDPGFDTDGLVVAQLTFPSSRYPERPQYLQRWNEMLDGLAAIPGVEGVASVRWFPLRGPGEGTRWSVPGQPTDEGGDRPQAYLLQVSPDYFRIMGIPLVEGSGFDASAGRDGRAMTVLSRSLALAAFGGEPALGKTIEIGGIELEIAGVAQDVRQQEIGVSTHPTLYIPQLLSPRRGQAFVVRSSRAAPDVMREVRALVASQDPSQAITELAPAREIVSGQADRSRFFALLLVAFASLALVLGAVGVYGTVAFRVARRRREVGIRLALGAEARDVRRLLLRQGIRPVAAGILLGLVGTLWLVRAAASLLFQVGVYDPLSYGAAVTTLLGVALVACWLPARAAARLDPVRTLAAED